MSIDPLGIANLKGLLTVVSIRNSSLGENSHSDERQGDTAEDFAQKQEMIIVGICEDVDVSGELMPWDREGLGAWLRGENGPFDAIVIAAFDRVGRNFMDFCILREWCIDNHKKLIVTAYGMDFASNETIPFILGNNLATIADVELRFNKARLMAGRKTTLEKRGALGGQMPYWCMQVQHKATLKGYEWEHHPERAKRTLEMIEWIEAGQSRLSLCTKFNEDGVPIPKAALYPERRIAAGKSRTNKGKGFAGKWQSITIKTILDNRMLIGQYETEQWERNRGSKKRRRLPGTLRTMTIDVTDDEGNLRPVPVQYMKPLLHTGDGITPDVERFERLRALLQPRKSIPRNAKPLTGVCFCFKCESPLYAGADNRGAEPREWFRCGRRMTATRSLRPQCDALSPLGHEVRAHIEEDFLSVMGEREICEPLRHVAKDHTQERKVLVAEYSDLMDTLIGAPAEIKTKYEPRKLSLQRRIAKLDELPQSAAWVEWIPTGKKLKEVWSEDWSRNGQIMRSLGIKVLADKYNFHIAYPEDIDARLQNLDISCDTVNVLNQDHTFSAS